MASKRWGVVVRMDVQIDGLSQLTRQLGDLVGDADAVMLEAITRVVTDTRAEAIRGIQRGPASGRVYEKYEPRRTHQASAPGQYPMSDTGRLANSVDFNLPAPGRFEGMVGTNVVYGRYLEFGTSRMAARPWLMPSFEKAKVGVEKRLRKAIEARL